MPISITGTSRQSLTASDGTKIQRQYVYLPETIWHQLQQQARSTSTSVSQIIESLATSGTRNSKESNDATRTCNAN